ncbi:nitrite/sulfite reductase [Labilibaculum sp. DW002]|uniref:Nitrite/sulfite reductase n=1 Tax=Paralabilibaculum antarcticum TaxID=2912572 RepID=A0ABT5VS16_9BACT|nr:nitrite/sulfite reductase [Labilibaculum sp. DW002]MDE5417582.1 nitrite/sulfite reductase [Labilibaculum sp. DW002]
MTILNSTNPSQSVKNDIKELESKIQLFKNGSIDQESFKGFHSIRGIHGQRQKGVQMVRIKIPYGRITGQQLTKIAELVDQFANGMLHITTRQDIQIYSVKIKDTPAIWSELDKVGLTIREACGHTVRNITASPFSGIDPKETFDVSPYAQALYEYILWNPFGQKLGRKLKFSFSSNEEDEGLSFIHDLGFIPKIKIISGEEKRGFKVMIGGGLGVSPKLADVATEFIPEDELIPFTEAVIRVFDRYGERNNRAKSRLKFLIKELGLSLVIQLINEEKIAVKHEKFVISRESYNQIVPNLKAGNTKDIEILNEDKYLLWLQTNVSKQKQEGFNAIQIKLTIGNIDSDTARKLAGIVKLYAADDIRLSITQGLILKFVTNENLKGIFNLLNEIGLAEPGADSTADVTSCPGTDTCVRAITNTSKLSAEIERVIIDEFPELIGDKNLRIKLSGCPNSCGQQSIASIGFHGTIFSVDGRQAPGSQIMLGGGITGDGNGVFSEKVIKIPAKRVPDALRIILSDFTKNNLDDKTFNEYYNEKTKTFYFDLLTPLTNKTNLIESDFYDWGNDKKFETNKIATAPVVDINWAERFTNEAKNRFEESDIAYENEEYADAIFHNYAALISIAKSILIKNKIAVNTEIEVINDFDNLITSKKITSKENSFKDTILLINKQRPAKAFADKYISKTRKFIEIDF